MLSQEDFIERSKKSQKRVFDYSKTVYTGMTNKVTIICPDHGVFTQSPQSHVNGANGCKGCGHRGRKDIMNTEKFINKAKLVHGRKFDYSETFYTIMKNKIEVRCVEHDLVFSQRPQSHLRGLNGCSECNGQLPITLDGFIKKSMDRFGNRFEYSAIAESDIKNMHSKVSLLCVEHNKYFTISINSHLRGALGCDYCKNNAPYSLETVVHKASKKFDKVFDYSQVNFTLGIRQHVSIGCSVKGHGFFSQTIDGHLSGKDGCSKCSMNGESKRESRRLLSLLSL